MPLHFDRSELAARRAILRRRLAAENLDGLLIFRQESMYYLTGYDTFGYVFFQCLYIGADGDMFLLTRKPDLLQAQLTSDIEAIHIWKDEDGADPASDLKSLLHKGKHLGIELDAYGLTAQNGFRLKDVLDGFCTLTDASRLVTEQRLIKSPAEIVYVRRAAELADDALDEAHRLTKPGADEGEILAAMQGAVFKGGGDYPGNEFIIGSGPQALLVRYAAGRRKLDAQDQLTLEFAGVYRHYHACLMRTILLGEVSQRQRDMHKAAVDAMAACIDAIKPGRTFGDVFAAHVMSVEKSGFADSRLNACGYSLGTTFSPNWMDWPMLYANNPVELQPGIVLFLHMILVDGARGLAMNPGQTVLVTEDGCEVLSRHDLDLVVK
ncbi:Xaa-Pro peptidase family protein [Dongia mobilis]|jgi:Xaa-Pro dipeptidase|uniref:M24 family metallopeptidase n=1 Tax=Dongia sp. TaxID=1977262 RepID=UPI0026E93E74